jgi:multimeric flavodoxin WrbA
VDRILFLLGSARRSGNTELLAREAAAQVADVPQRWLHLSDVPLAPFEDFRHDGSWTTPVGNEAELYSATLEASDLVFASPTYWYSLSAPTKLYLDYWTKWLRLPGFREAMVGKTLWVVTTLTDGRHRTRPLIEPLQWTAQYMRMRWGGALIGSGNRPGDVLSDTVALREAKTFFTR